MFFHNLLRIAMAIILKINYLEILLINNMETNIFSLNNNGDKNDLIITAFSRFYNQVV